MTLAQDYPNEVRETLTQLIETLDQRFGDNYSLATYGGLSRRRFPQDQNALNVALIVARLSEDVLRALREPLSQAMRRCRFDFFLLEYAQLGRVADSFPVKLLEMKTHHEMLRGRDPFSGLTVHPRFVRLRLEQESRNHLMRLRRTFLLSGDSRESLMIAIRKSIGALLSDCEAILVLEGLSLPDDLDALLRLIAEHLGIQIDVLRQLVAFREARELAEVQNRYFELLTVVEQVALFVDELDQDS